MIDFVLLAFVGLIIVLGFKRPFLWVLLYIYIDIVIPQKIGYGIMTSPALKLSLLAFVLAFAGWLVFDNKQGSRFAFRQWLIVALLGWCGMTTLVAAFPDSAWAKWDWVWKALVFAAFLPLTLRTRLRIEAAALVMVLAIGAIVISGGLKTVFGGGGYGTLRLLVNENAGIYEGSIISTFAIATIPLAWWLARHGTIFKQHWTVTAFAAGLTFACLLIPVGTTARTGLVCIAVLGVLMLRSVRYRFVYGGAAALALFVAIPFLPASYLERMSTITDYSQEQSASTRIAVWKWTVDYAKRNPLGGGFDAYRANSFTYQMPQVSGPENAQSVEYVEVTDEARAYHSSYFEMLGEQGWLGLALFLWLHALGLWQMERLRRAHAPPKGERPGWVHGLATSLQQAQVVYLVGAAFVGIAYQPFAYMIIGLQIALWSWCKRQGEIATAAADAHNGSSEVQPA